MRRPGLRTIASSLALAAALAGCATSRTAGPAVTASAQMTAAESGFLTSYENLAPTEQFADLKLWRDDSVRKGFRRILFRPVEVWRGADARLDDVPEDDLQYVADALYKAVADRLGKSFELVSEPAEGVLEIHLAFTLVTSPESKVDFFSTAVPVRGLAVRTGPLDPGTKRFLQECALEAEFSETLAMKGANRRRPPKKVVAAFFDTRRGAATPKGAVETWEQTEAVFERWSAMLDERLTSLRSGTFKPKLTVKKPVD